MDTFPHLSDRLKAQWSEALLTKRGGGLEAGKEQIKGRIRGVYAEHMARCASHRSRLLEAQARLRGLAAREMGNVRNLERATRDLDLNVNTMAAAIQIAYAAARLVKPAVAVGASLREASANKVLVRESMEYWPGVNQFRAAWSEVERARVVRSLRELGRHLATEVGMEAAEYVVNELTHLLEPSHWARVAMGTSPEQEFAVRRRQIQAARQRSERVVAERIRQLNAQLERLRIEMTELLRYIDEWRTVR